MGMGFLAPNYDDSYLFPAHNFLRRRNFLQPSHPDLSATSSEVSLAETGRHRTMGKQTAEKYLVGSVRETLQGHCQADCAVELYLLLLYLRMGRGYQHHAFDLPHPAL